MPLVRLVHRETGAVAEVRDEHAELWRQYGYADLSPAKKPARRKSAAKPGAKDGG